MSKLGLSVHPDNLSRKSKELGKGFDKTLLQRKQEIEERQSVIIGMKSIKEEASKLLSSPNTKDIKTFLQDKSGMANRLEFQ